MNVNNYNYVNAIGVGLKCPLKGLVSWTAIETTSDFILTFSKKEIPLSKIIVLVAKAVFRVLVTLSLIAPAGVLWCCGKVVTFFDKNGVACQTSNIILEGDVESKLSLANFNYKINLNLYMADKAVKQIIEKNNLFEYPINHRWYPGSKTGVAPEYLFRFAGTVHKWMFMQEYEDVNRLVSTLHEAIILDQSGTDYKGFLEKHVTVKSGVDKGNFINTKFYDKEGKLNKAAVNFMLKKINVLK